jgi:hypothetical protein
MMGPPHTSESNGSERRGEETDLWREIRLDLNAARTEAERSRILENAIISPFGSIKVGAYETLLPMWISILAARYIDKKEVADELPMLRANFEACKTGFIHFDVEDNFGSNGLEARYSIRIVRGEGSAIADKIFRCLPAEVGLFLPEAREDYNQTLACSYRPIAVELRTLLVRVGWLKDDFGPIDPELREARDRIGAGRSDEKRVGQ